MNKMLVFPMESIALLVIVLILVGTLCFCVGFVTYSLLDDVGVVDSVDEIFDCVCAESVEPMVSAAYVEPPASVPLKLHDKPGAVLLIGDDRSTLYTYTPERE
jgi:hypothetical protein